MTTTGLADPTDRRCVEHQVITLFKKDEIPLNRRAITSAIEDRLKLERDFALLGKIIAGKQKQVNWGIMKN